MFFKRLLSDQVETSSLKNVVTLPNLIKSGIIIFVGLAFSIVIKFIYFNDNMDSLHTYLSLLIILGVIIILFNSYLSMTNSSEFLEIDKEKANNNKYLYGGYQIDKDTGIIKQEYEKCNDFFKYSNSMILYLDNQIILSDKKSSLLLSKGKFWAVLGIILYIISIITWQVLSHIYQFKTIHIYGIASSSLLFIFIEFFSAWYLRKYKHFVDTSTYLIKIKTNIQRYILAYLALKDSKEKDLNLTQLILMLKKEIKWPDTFSLKNTDINFVKECMEMATNLISSFPINNKDKDGK